MAKVYKSICNEADILLYRITHLTEKQIRYKLEMERLMNRGFVKIAKARYIMGSTCVTKMQLPSENSNPIQPIATVCRAEKNNHWIFHIHRKDPANRLIKKSNTRNPERVDDNGQASGQLNDNDISNVSPHFSEEDFKNTLQKNPKALKQARNAFHVDDSNYEDCKEELLDEFSNQGSNESLYSLSDPMRLFGILVPNVLKSAQDEFISVVNLLGKCASLQSELKETLHRYNHMQKVKALMEIAAAEAKINILETKVYWTHSEDSMMSCLSNTKDNENEDKVSVTRSVRSVFYQDDQAPKSPKVILNLSI